METTASITAPCIFPVIRFANAARMLDWLGEAFGFSVLTKSMDGARVGHAELALGSSIVMCGDHKDDAFGAMTGKPGTPSGWSLYVAVTDIETLFKRAEAAGAEILQGLTDRDYGSREFICRDPEGNVWSFGTYWPKAVA